MADNITKLYSHFVWVIGNLYLIILTLAIGQIIMFKGTWHQCQYNHSKFPSKDRRCSKVKDSLVISEVLMFLLDVFVSVFVCVSSTNDWNTISANFHSTTQTFRLK